MKARWYISALIFLLTLFGVVNQQQTYLPNQEIILQFADADLTSQAAKNTIDALKTHLQAIGVNNIKVKEGENGILKITYYSDFDILSIKNGLLKNSKLVLNYDINYDDKGSKFPLEDFKINCKVDVHEIQKINTKYSDLDCKLVFEPKLTNDRSFNTNFNISFRDLCFKLSNNITKVAYKASNNTSIKIKDAFSIIPEVRAGPNLMLG